MFKDFISLTEVRNLNYFDSSSTTNMSYMFYNTPKIATINLDDLDMGAAVNMTNMFNSYHVAYTYPAYTDCTTVECSIDELYRRINKTPSTLDTIMVSGPDFQTTISPYKANITSVEFMNSKTQPSGTLIASYDVSDSQSGSVMAYIMQNGTGKYKLYIGADDGVVGNFDESTMFKDFTGLIEVKNLNYFDTSYVKDMSYMFYNTPSLQTLNVDELKISHVEKTTNIFSSYQLSYSNSAHTTCTTAECSIDELSEIFNAN